MDVIRITPSQLSATSSTSLEAHPMDAVLRPLFVALPLPQGIDGSSLLAGYRIALEGEAKEATMRVVERLIKGTWYDPITFCPRPPELANMVRREAKLIADKGKTREEYIREAIRQNNSW